MQIPIKFLIITKFHPYGFVIHDSSLPFPAAADAGWNSFFQSFELGFGFQYFGHKTKTCLFLAAKIFQRKYYFFYPDILVDLSIAVCCSANNLGISKENAWIKEIVFTLEYFSLPKINIKHVFLLRSSVLS